MTKHLAGSSVCPTSPCTMCFTKVEEDAMSHNNGLLRGLRCDADKDALGILRQRLRKITDKIERNTNKNNLGHGEHACLFCDARGHADVEHKDGCPIGALWVIVGEL